MSPRLKRAFEMEMRTAASAYNAQDYETSFSHLERAHILGQGYLGPHFKSHIQMFRIGLAKRDAREIFGQVLRIAAVFPANIFGWLPVGNTGGANVSALRHMPIPDDLKVYFED